MALSWAMSTQLGEGIDKEVHMKVKNPLEPSSSSFSLADLRSLVLLALNPRSPLGFWERWGLILWLEGADRGGLW